MWWWNLIMLVACYPAILFYYFAMNNAAVRRNLYFSVSVKPEWRGDTELLEIVRVFKRQMKRSMIAGVILPLCIFFLPWFSVSFTVWMMWLLGMIAAGYIFFGMANRKTANWKTSRLKDGEKGETEPAGRTEPKASEQIREVRFRNFLPQLLCMLAVIFICVLSGVTSAGRAFWAEGGREAERNLYLGCIILFASLTVLFYLCALWSDRMKEKLISADSKINGDYNRAGKVLWRKFWSSCTWGNLVCTLGIMAAVFAEFHETETLLILSILECFWFLCAMFFFLKGKQKLETCYEQYRDVEDETQDERNWIFGLFYYNPADRHISVENRLGIGTAVNMATKTGKGLMLFGSVVFLSMPILCLVVILEEFTPIHVRLDDTELVCRHIRVEYQIPLEEIDNITVLTQLPEKLRRVNGTGMENLKKGNYSNREEGIVETGPIKVFLNPQNSVFLYLETEESNYLIGGYDDEETEAVYQEMKKFFAWLIH